MAFSTFSTTGSCNNFIKPNVLTNTVISDRLVNYNFDSGTAIDSWGTFHATNIGGSITTNRFKNGAYSCTSDGVVNSNIYIQTPDINYTASKGITFSLWYWNMASTNTTQDIKIFEFSSLMYLWSIGTGAYCNFGNSGNVDFDGLEKWQHIVISITSTGLLKLYVNANYGTNITYQLGNGLSSQLPAGGRIGRSLSSGHWSIRGNIDDFRIYNKVLNITEITGLFNGTYT